MSWNSFLAKSSNLFLLVETRSPYEQVLGALGYGCNHKGVKVFLASHHLTGHEGEVTLTLKLSQIVRSTNLWREEGRQPLLPITLHS